MIRRSRLARAALVLAVSASLLLPGRAAQAQSDEDKAAARALATQGSEALKTGRFVEALDLVSRAEAIVHAPTHLLMIARSQVGLGKLVSAQETYLKLMREELKDSAPAAFKNAQVTAKEELAVIEPKIASLRISIDGVGGKQITVKMDNQLVSTALVGVYRPVDPGKHEIGIFPVGLSPVKGIVELRDGEKKEIRLVIPDGPPPPGVPLNATDNPDAGKPGDTAAPRKDSGPGFMTPLRGVGIGAVALGVGGVVVGALFAAKGGSTQSQADDIALNKYHCNPTCLPPTKAGVMRDVIPLDNTAASQKTIGVIGLAAGGVALAAGVTLLVIGKPKPAPAPAAKASVEPWFSGTGGGLRGEF
jgi:hypothetical protein